MKKVSWRITSNHKPGKELVEYDYITYHCEDDDVWINTEVPIVKDTDKK